MDNAFYSAADITLKILVIWRRSTADREHYYAHASQFKRERSNVHVSTKQSLNEPDQVAVSLIIYVVDFSVYQTEHHKVLVNGV